ncbi:MAG: response regulator transcription factor [Terriglobales bacterium]
MIPLDDRAAERINPDLAGRPQLITGSRQLLFGGRKRLSERAAQALNPDLILLDIGLPTLNGIEGARQIHKLVPESKIIFVSQESSPDVVQETLSLGARGYVLKTRAASDLLAAVDAVLAGKQFVSDGLLGSRLLSSSGCASVSQ